MLRAHMAAFGHLREQRRLSGWIVAALVILGAFSASHHHRLVAATDALAITAPEAFDAGTRSTDCVVCRAADPARVEIARLSLPRFLVTSIPAPAPAEHALTASFRPCSPRAPPVATA
jgi:hypothetical protein